MKANNIYNFDLITPKNSENLGNNFYNVIEDSGITAIYKHFDTNYNRYDVSSQHTVKCFLVPNSDTNEGSLDTEIKYTAYFSTKHFYASDGVLIGVPNNKDIIVINEEEYHLSDIFYYGVNTLITNSIKNSIMFSAKIFKKGDYTPNSSFSSIF